VSAWADYSFARPALADLKKAGIVGLFRYLAPLPNKKVIDTPERDAILAAGFDLVLNWEWYEGRCNQGGNAGKQDATEAVRQAKALGYPQGAGIYFSHDTGTNDWAAIEAYFTAAKAVVHAAGYTIGAYGSYYLIQFLHQRGLIDYGWQTKAWSGGQRDQWAVIYQDGSALVAGTDNDIVNSADIGSWKGADVALSADDRQYISDQIKAAVQAVHNDAAGTYLRVAQDDPIIQRLGQQVDSLAKAVAALPGGSASGPDAKAVVDEMGRRLTAGA